MVSAAIVALPSPVMAAECVAPERPQCLAPGLAGAHCKDTPRTYLYEEQRYRECVKGKIDAAIRQANRAIEESFARERHAEGRLNCLASGATDCP
jgi:hypothetical protein